MYDTEEIWRIVMPAKNVKFIDLFAGLGGIRIGFEQAFKAANYTTECVYTSEVKAPAIEALNYNFHENIKERDITKVKASEIPNFDFLLGGFPCQAFSVAGRQRGFMDTRGTLFFDVERILKEKKPYGFLLENVEGLVTHDRELKNDKMGRTLKTILNSLESLGYKVNWKVLNSQNFGVAQNRNRIYIIGTLKQKISLENFEEEHVVFDEIMEKGLSIVDTEFTRNLLAKYDINELNGKSIKDKRGGKNNIHSWDLELRGKVSKEEKKLMDILLKERRKKHWAEVIGIEWMDGMPLTMEQISTFYESDELENMLKDLTKKGYLSFEYPKQKVIFIDAHDNSRSSSERVKDINKPKGYNIVTGKLSFEFSRILNPQSVTPTLVAMDMDTIGVIDGKGLRHLTLREGLRLFGYPDNYSLDIFDNSKKIRKGFDLLGNTVCVPVIEKISERLEEAFSCDEKGR